MYPCATILSGPLGQDAPATGFIAKPIAEKDLLVARGAPADDQSTPRSSGAL